MNVRDFAELTTLQQENLLMAASISESLRYWVPTGSLGADAPPLDDVVWAAVVGCARMFAAGQRDPLGKAAYERLIAAVPDRWMTQDPTDLGQDSAQDAA